MEGIEQVSPGFGGFQACSPRSASAILPRGGKIVEYACYRILGIFDQVLLFSFCYGTKDTDYASYIERIRKTRNRRLPSRVTNEPGRKVLVHITRSSRFQTGDRNATESKASFAKEAIPRTRMTAIVKNIP